MLSPRLAMLTARPSPTDQSTPINVIAVRNDENSPIVRSMGRSVARRSEVRGLNRIGNGVDEMRSRRTGFRQMVDGPAFVETGHLNRIFHRRSFTVDAQRSLAVLSNGDDATVNLRCERTVYRYLLVTSRLSLRQRRIVEIRKTDGALDLERAFTFEKDRRCMGIDPANMRMGGGVRKEGEDALLDPRVG